MKPGHSVLPKIRLTASGTDLITILRCFLAFKTVLTSRNIIAFKIKISRPKNGHQSRAWSLVPCAASCPVDINPLGNTMVYKYKIDRVKNTVTSKCCLCLRELLEDWQKEGINFFKYKTFSAVLNCNENRTLYSLAAANKQHMYSSDITQEFTYGKLDVPLFCHPPPGFKCPEGTVLGLNYCLYGAKQAPAGFKSVITDFHLGEGLKAVNDAQSMWVKHLAP